MKIICIIILAVVVSLHVVVFLLLLAVPMHMHSCKIFSILLDLFVVAEQTFYCIRFTLIIILMI